MSVKKLVALLQKSKYIVAHTGAGISTSTGIPDFRGPSGVWTREAQGLPPVEQEVRWEDVKPSFTHMVQHDSSQQPSELTL